MFLHDLIILASGVCKREKEGDWKKENEIERERMRLKEREWDWKRREISKKSTIRRRMEAKVCMSIDYWLGSSIEYGELSIENWELAENWLNNKEWRALSINWVLRIEN